MLSAKDLFFTPAATGAYTVNNSLRFRSSASAYLSRTYGTPTNNKIYTFSFWVKRGNLGAEQELLNANANSSQFYFSASDTLNFYDATSGAYYTTTQVFRDVSAWYHIVVSQNTPAASNRFLMYVNGVQVTAFTTSTAPTQNNSSAFNVASTVHTIGRYNPTTTNYLDGYLAEVNFIDGQALTPSSFGQTDATTGVWQPKAYTGTYGTNGFYLKFADASGATATTIGKDSSGNGNNWTPTNISVTTGVTYDAMVDSPTNSAAASNYAVLNPLIPSTNTFSAGNLQITAGAAANAKFVSTIGASSGKYYMEFTVSAWPNAAIGITSTTVPQSYLASADGSTSVGFWPNTTNTALYVNGVSQTFSGSATTWTNTDVAGLALDADNRTISLYKNGTLVGSAYSYASLWSGTTYFAGGNYISGQIYYANFGQRPFTYTPPSGFVALNTQNLPTPTIAAGNKHFDATTYTGTGSAMSVTNSGGFQPDFVWIKQRNGIATHVLANVITGVSNYLFSNLTNAEAVATAGTGITSFNTSGFSLGTETSTSGSVNAAGGTGTYVGWQWKGGGTGVSNTSGTITSTVSANVSAGFSVVTYTGASTTGTVGHGLGVAPSMIIVKTRNAVADWYVYHVSNGLNKYMYMNLTNAVVSAAGYFDTVSSTVFGGTSAAGIISTNNFVAYCFAPVAGYSAFGSYTGNGSADGPFVFTGFRPRWIMIKRTDSTGNWFVWDSSRDPYNTVLRELYPDSSSAETTRTGVNDSLDFLSNGFKLRFSSTYADRNASGGTYVYACFAENPFSIARAR